MKFINWTVSPCFRAGGISSSSSFAHWWWQTVVFLGSASETSHGPMSYRGWAPWSKRTAELLTGRWTSRWPLANISDRSLEVHQCNKLLPNVYQGVWGDWGEASFLGKYRGVAVCNLTGECCENCGSEELLVYSWEGMSWSTGPARSQQLWEHGQKLSNVGTALWCKMHWSAMWVWYGLIFKSIVPIDFHAFWENKH